MAGGYAWSRRVMARVRTLRALVNDTQLALHDTGVNILSIEPEIHSTVREIGHQASRTTALVVLGNSSKARARLLHCLLGRQLLPEDMPRGCRWIRIQHGSSTQVHLSLGNSEFELVEELECNQRAWDVLPVKDLIRQDVTELTTILEVEINNQFLKDGLCIIIPADIGTDPGASNHLQLKNTHSEFYAKRSSILKNFNCVYLYGVDTTGKNIFSDNFCGSINMAMTSDEDFWDTYNLYTGSMRTFEKDGDGDDGANGDERVAWAVSEGGEPAVFSSENCLDFHQIKDINANSQLLFFLFSDAVEQCARDVMGTTWDVPGTTWDASSDELPEADRGMRNTARQTSESPEPKQDCDNAKQRLIQEQVAFMNELIEQWELMSNRPRKHYVKSQWAILDDTELMRTVDLKHAPAYIAHAHSTSETCSKGRHHDKIIRSRNILLSAVVKFGTESVHSYLLAYCTKLSEVHILQLQRLILASFSLARELQVVPRRVRYVAKHEQQLYQTINEKFSQGDKKQELLEIMQEVIQEMKTEINNMDWSVDLLPCHQDRHYAMSSSLSCSMQSSAYASLPPSPPAGGGWAPSPPSDGEDAALYDSYNLDEYDIIGCEESYSECCNNNNDNSTADGDSSPSSDILVENETEMFSLSTARWSLRDVTCSGSGLSHKHATADVQQIVLTRLSRKISLKLVKFFGCLKESYFGTLQRCVESLEGACRRELGGRPASEAMRQLLSAGRRVQLHPAAAGRAAELRDSLYRLLYRLRLVGGEEEEACCVLSAVWRRRVALQFTQSLSPHRLARIISTQIISRLSEAHERYQSALASLEAALAARLHHTEDVKLAIRKVHAPMFAKLCLESTSMCDLLMYGTPELGREIGRGQYGVVYSARGGWGGKAPVAVKSVLPADERHYRELAMEFFYTRSIPPHPRIVRLYGSVVTRTGGNGRCVLLVSARKVRDLHCAVRAGLPARDRMRIACDIVEGIRYLHSLGLVHRDIKLKNVLLDASGRAALSDLGFCAAGALMSGSVVGTPVHMAPELGAGPYCASVDVYAFGVLFWYLCAGDVRLPAAFEVFNNKQQLWSKVKKGRRPERLPHFTDECWSLMESCWHADPQQRPLLGDVYQQLQKILQHTDDTVPYVHRDADEDSLDLSTAPNWDM